MKKAMSIEEMTKMLEDSKDKKEDYKDEEKCEVCGEEPCSCDDEDMEDDSQEDGNKKPMLFGDDKKKAISILIEIGKKKK